MLNQTATLFVLLLAGGAERKSELGFERAEANHNGRRKGVEDQRRWTVKGSTRNSGQRWQVRGRGGVSVKPDLDFARVEATGGTP